MGSLARPPDAEENYRKETPLKCKKDHLTTALKDSMNKKTHEEEDA